MTQLNYQIPIILSPNSSEDPKVHDALSQIQTVVNGQLGPDNHPIGTFLQLLVAGTAYKVNFGQVPSFSWNTGFDATIVTAIVHGFSTAPLLVIPFSGGWTAGGSADTPWSLAVGNLTATTFDMQVATRNNAALGAFTVNAGQRPWWLAIGT